MRKLRPLLALALTGAALLACARIAGLDQSGGSGAGLTVDAGSVTSSSGAKISPGSVVIPMPCGSAGTSQVPVSIENPTPARMHYVIAVNGADDVLTILDEKNAPSTSVSGDLDPNTTSPRYAINASAVATKPQSLTITTGDAKQALDVTTPVQGPALALQFSTIKFGDVHQGSTTAPQPVVLLNTGSEPVNVTGWKATDVASAPDFKFDPSGRIDVDAGSPPINVTWTAPTTSTDEVRHTFQPVVEGKPLCGTPPTLTVSGRPVSTQVTVNPSELDYGNVSCGDAPQQQLTVQNFATTDATWRVTAAPASFTVTPQSGTAFANNSAKITVSPSPGLLPRDGFQETLGIQIDGPSSTTAQIVLTASIRGGYLDVSPSNAMTAGNNKSATVTVTNSGNETVDLVLQSGTTNFDVAYEGGGTETGISSLPFFNGANVIVTQRKGGSVNGSFTFKRGNFGARLCNSPIPTVALTGQ